MIHHGDLFDVLPTLGADTLDACVTDPPYDLVAGSRKGSGRSNEPDNPFGRHGSKGGGFMGLKWDATGVAFRIETWEAICRVLKPGAHLVAFGAPRTFHRMTCAIEDAGFEIRDCLSWLYGQGFPKSLNLGRGQGTALKPGWEPIILARKPIKTSIRENVRTHGCGGLNIDACRIDPGAFVPGGGNGQAHNGGRFGAHETNGTRPVVEAHDLGRWPANVVLDDDAAALLDEQTGELTSGAGRKSPDGKPHGFMAPRASVRSDDRVYDGDSGGASRFYYVAKPSRAERDEGCHALARGRNIHPTVKPLDLMRWLVRLVTPRGGTVLDPFCGSGTTGMACRYELREFIGVEREAGYIAIAERRIGASAPLFESERQQADETAS